MRRGAKRVNLSFENFSDQEIFRILNQLKIPHGPVTRATRSTFEKILKEKFVNHKLSENLSDGEVAELAKDLGFAKPDFTKYSGRTIFERSLFQENSLKLLAHRFPRAIATSSTPKDSHTVRASGSRSFLSPSTSTPIVSAIRSAPKDLSSVRGSGFQLSPAGSGPRADDSFPCSPISYRRPTQIARTLEKKAPRVQVSGLRHTSAVSAGRDPTDEQLGFDPEIPSWLYQTANEHATGPSESSESVGKLASGLGLESPISIQPTTAPSTGKGRSIKFIMLCIIVVLVALAVTTVFRRKK